MTQDDEVIRMVNDNYVRAKLRSIEQDREQKAEYYQEKRTLYQIEKKKKRKGTRNTAILAICASAVLVSSIYGINSELNKIDTRQDFISSINDGVVENTIYTNTLNADGNGFTWYYKDIDDIANRTLNEHKDIDIDTRIYGTYTSLNDYKKSEYMDDIMQSMQGIVSANPDAYTEDEIRASNNATFKDYLNSLGLDEDEYKKLMDDITLAYGRNDQEKVAELLNRLTEGLNSGGR